MSDQWGQPEQPSGGWSIPQPEQDPNQGTFGAQGQQPYDSAPASSAPLPQYGQQIPPQPQYGDPQQFGMPQPGFDPAYGYPVYGQPPSNNIAIAGFILSIFFWPVGLILSIVGVVKAGQAGGKGRGLAIAGIAIAVVLAIITVVLIAVGTTAPAADPGCTSAETQMAQLDSQIDADQDDPDALIGDLNTVKSDLDSSLAKAKHQNVRDQIQLVDTDLSTFLGDYNALKANPDDTDMQDSLQSDLTKLQTDADDLDDLCTTF